MPYTLDDHLPTYIPCFYFLTIFATFQKSDIFTRTYLLTYSHPSPDRQPRGAENNIDIRSKRETWYGVSPWISTQRNSEYSATIRMVGCCWMMDFTHHWSEMATRTFSAAVGNIWNMVGAEIIMNMIRLLRPMKYSTSDQTPSWYAEIESTHCRYFYLFINMISNLSHQQAQTINAATNS